jgi:hypothetical protein
VTLAPLRQYGAAAVVGTIAGALIFFLVAAGSEPDLFMQQRQLAACLGGTMGVAMIFAHLWRPAY